MSLTERQKEEARILARSCISLVHDIFLELDLFDSKQSVHSDLPLPSPDASQEMARLSQVVMEQLQTKALSITSNLLINTRDIILNCLKIAKEEYEKGISREKTPGIYLRGISRLAIPLIRKYLVPCNLF